MVLMNSDPLQLSATVPNTITAISFLIIHNLNSGMDSRFQPEQKWKEANDIHTLGLNNPTLRLSVLRKRFLAPKC